MGNMHPLLGGCLFLGRSFIGGSTVPLNTSRTTNTKCLQDWDVKQDLVSIFEIFVEDKIQVDSN